MLAAVLLQPYATGVCASENTGQQVVAEPLPASLPPPKIVETEIVGFTLQGRKDRERLTIPDLDVVPSADGRRLLPLFRLLEALRWEAREEGGRISFQPEGSEPVVLDLPHGEIIRNGAPRRLELLEAISDVTNKREIYIPPEELAAIFALEMLWDQENYGYSARTERSLAIWKVEKGMSLFAIKTEEITSTLPEAHPAAGPRSRYFNLDFIRLQGRLNWNAVNKDFQSDLLVDSLEQTFWGDFLKGRYRVRFSETPLTWDWSKVSGTDPVVRLPWGELEYRWGLSQVVLGDSVFGLSDLAFPSARITGLRFNGLLGVDGQNGESDRSGRGTSLNFNRPLAFSGRARVGSKVSLTINGLVVEAVEVLTSLPGEAGVGAFTFEAIQVAPGSLNDITIAVTDPDGIVTVTERKIVGSSSLMPGGALAYLGGVGTYREQEEWISRGIFAGTRFLYGLGNSATVGATVAYQRSFFDPDIVIDDVGERPYPAESGHAGVQLAWQPFSRALLSGDIAWATQEYSAQPQGRTGHAWRVNADLFPLKGLQLHGRYFWYGPDFFDGQSRNLSDRKGYILYGTVSPWSVLELTAAAARVEDNVEGQVADTSAVDLQHAEIATRLIPRSTLTLAYDRLAPNWGEDPKELTSIEVRSTLVPNWSFTGYYSTGDDVTLGENTDFLDGLRLPVISLAESRNSYASLSRELPWGGSLQLQYRDTSTEERLSLVHTTGTLFGATILLRTELGQDLQSGDLFFEHRAEYPLPGWGGSRFQLQARYERDVWTVGLFFTLLELYRNDAVLPRRVQGQRFDPESGGIAGSVFIDANANAVRDSGEPGLGNIKVSVDGMRFARTDDRGNFLFSAMSGARNGKIFVDPGDLPAIYLCTHCLQHYRGEPGRIVEIHFGLAPANAVSGYVKAPAAGGAFAPVPGVRVTITAQAGGDPAATSVTAGDGSYYLGNILPGAYTVRVDQETVPAGFRLAAVERAVALPAAVEPNDLQDVDFLAETVNAVPVAAVISVKTDENTPLPITLTAKDAEGQPLTFRITSGPTHGTLSGAAPRLIYTPDPDYRGPDSFSFSAGDGIDDSAPAGVSITVRPANTAPRAVDDAAGTDAGVPVTIDVLGNDTDVDDDPLEVSAAVPGAHGTVSFKRTAVTYIPKAGFFGVDTFTYTAGDGRGGAAQATVRVTVAARAPKMHVANIAKWLATEDGQTFAKMRVTVVNESGSPVPGAAVTGSWSGAVTGAATAVTNQRGTVVLSSARTAAAVNKRFVLTISGLAKDGWLYDPGANAETGDSIWGQ